jgi:6-phosphofructokinase 1
VRADTFGYLQRSFPGVVSPVDAAEARQVGRKAVEVATAGQHPHGSIAILRERGAPYRARFERTELANVATETRPMEPELLKGDNDVTPAFLDYVRPLVGELPYPARLSDFPIG